MVLNAHHGYTVGSCFIKACQLCVNFFQIVPTSWKYLYNVGGLCPSRLHLFTPLWMEWKTFCLLSVLQIYFLSAFSFPIWSPYPDLFIPELLLWPLSNSAIGIKVNSVLFVKTCFLWPWQLCSCLVFQVSVSDKIYPWVGGG